MKWIVVLLSTFSIGLVGCNPIPNKSKEVSEILKQLDAAKSEADRSQATERLQRLGTNAFPFLMAEMNSFKWHTPQEKDKAVIDRAQRLRAAFDVFGTNLVPLRDEFVQNLDTNQNFVSAIDGLVAMGEHGTRDLIGAMTNRAAAIRLNAVAAILKLGRKNSGIAGLAVPNLILLLKDQSVVVRSLAAETLGVHGASSDTSIPALLQLALTDPDVVVRSQAVKAVGRIQIRLGHMAVGTRSILERISMHDNSHVVRASAERVLKETQPQ